MDGFSTTSIPESDTQSFHGPFSFLRKVECVGIRRYQIAELPKGIVVIRAMKPRAENSESSIE